MQRRFRTSALIVLLSLYLPVTAAERVIGAFSDKDISDWEPHAFKGETDYRLVEIDGRNVLSAECNNAASGLFYRQTINLRHTPILRWSWRVDNTFNHTDETIRTGDDFAARIYVVRENPILHWRTRALNYVWASRMPRGSDWPNPFLSQARMIAMRSGSPAEPGTWHTEEVNVRADFKRFHGVETDTISAVAIMTDCDNTGKTARAWYGDLKFTAARTGAVDDDED
ncbi:MAG: DUF3047 domain-containing protein [Aquisalimonadaceae bacterium]